MVMDDLKAVRVDIHYHEHGPSLDYHFCREWDESGGCYGTNPNHGFTLTDAAEHLARWHETQARMYRDGTHYQLLQFREDPFSDEASPPTPPPPETTPAP
jgi:hypothetical protein